MSSSKILSILIMALPLALLTACGESVGKSKCATPLTYVVNATTRGVQAYKRASEYHARIPYGQDNYFVDAVVDTASSNLVINEKSYVYGGESQKGAQQYVFNNGSVSSVAVNAKDSFDIACTENVSAKFSLTNKNLATPNYLGLSLPDPENRPHENMVSPFFPQLSQENGINSIFALSLCGSKGRSRVLLGGIDEKMLPYINKFIPIIETTSYVVQPLDIRRADNSEVVGNFFQYDTVSKSGTRTIIDSATSFLVLPRAMVQTIKKHIMNRAKHISLLDDFRDDYFRTDSDAPVSMMRFANLAQIDEFPTFEIRFKGVNQNDTFLTLSPRYYFKIMSTEDTLWRTFAFRESVKDNVLGQPFLENNYTVFDLTNRTIGFGDIHLACAFQ